MVCPLHWSGVFSLYRMPLRGSYSVYGAPSTSPCAHQPSLAAYPWAHLRIVSCNISSHSWRWTELSPHLLHSRRRHAVTTTTVFVRLWSAACTDHLLIYQSAVALSQLLALRMKRPAGSDSAWRHFYFHDHTMTLSFNSNYSFAYVDLAIILLFRPR